jgi:hypothetical protein
LDLAYHLTFRMVHRHFVRPAIGITAKPNRYLTMFWPKDGSRTRFKSILFCLQFQILNKVQTPSDTKYNMPLSEPFRHKLLKFPNF